MLTIVIRVSTPSLLDEVRQVVGHRPLRLNHPQWQVDFDSREKAHLALVNLNAHPGISAYLCGELHQARSSAFAQSA
jgi:hypothetical protein